MSVKNLLKKYLPENVRGFISKTRDNIYQKTVIDLYVYGIIGPRLNRALSQREKPIKYLFVISPMRSGSTLLVHILNGHPSISGYGESHVSYLNPEDLFRLAARTRFLEPNCAGSEDFFMDKMVWNYQISDEVLATGDIYFLFLLRDPADTFKSMGKLADYDPQSQGLKKWRDPENCLVYYQKRLAAMTQLAKRVNNPERCLLLEYESLINTTESTLQTLQQFLGLDQPLSEEYPVSEKSGNFRYGDLSSNIKSGKILRKVNRATPQAEPPTILEARKIYDQYMEEFQQHCEVVITNPVTVS